MSENTPQKTPSGMKLAGSADFVHVSLIKIKDAKTFADALPFIYGVCKSNDFGEFLSGEIVIPDGVFEAIQRFEDTDDDAKLMIGILLLKTGGKSPDGLKGAEMIISEIRKRDGDSSKKLLSIKREYLGFIFHFAGTHYLSNKLSLNLEKRGFDYLLSSANLSYSPAYYLLAKYLTKGSNSVGVTRNYLEAYKWLLLANAFVEDLNKSLYELELNNFERDHPGDHISQGQKLAIQFLESADQIRKNPDMFKVPEPIVKAPPAE